MGKIWTMGELLVEIMRPRTSMPLEETGEFIGPFPSGAPAIFADTVSRMGHYAGIIGGVGKDGFGENILRRLIRDGVDCSNVIQCSEKSTAVAFVSYSEDGSRNFIFHIDGTSATECLIPESIASDVDFFHVMGCSLMINELLREKIIETARRFHRNGVNISFDPNIRFELLRGDNIHSIIGPLLEYVSILMPGKEELLCVSGKNDPDEAYKHLLKTFGISLVVMKKGKSGCRVYSPNQQIDILAPTVKEVDPTGAGDCFDAAFLCSLIENKSLEECARIASAIGALNAMKFGPMEGDFSPILVNEMKSKTKLLH